MTTSSEEPEEPTLTALNERLHRELDEALVSVVLALVAGDLDETERRWHGLRARLDAHAAVEEEAVMPRYRSLGDHPRGGGPELVEGDHRGLDKNVAACERALERLRAVEGDPRRAVVDELDTFLRVRRLLDHHTEREQRFVYPRLDEVLEASDRDALRGELARRSAA